MARALTTAAARCVVFTGGGTAGHVFPGLAVAAELARRWDGRIVWIGSRGGPERSLVEAAGIAFRSIPAGKLRRYRSLENLTDAFRIVGGLAASLAALAAERPSLVFSKGGFVSVPPVVAARLLGIPAFTHESDLDPGLATRINARFCERILVSHEATAAHFPPALRDRVVVTGNPVRAAIYAADAAEGRRFAGCAPSERLVLVLGGSSGSAFLNGLVAGAAAGLCAHGIRIVHQTGDGKQGAGGIPGCRVMPFIGAELPHLMAAADLVVCRAGANTLAELAALGRPSLLVPLSSAGSRGDQLRNAEAFRAAGAAEVMGEETASPAALADRVLGLLADPARLAAMGAAARALAPADPALRIAGMLAARLGGGAGGGATPRGSA
ncbi:MAG TPA: undecaprenyldiphospho-muramoylpentapeptide beta-N-acetylglucosaminyltransferase [Desulfobacterales bacterium]|nr:undecaprenyldiphospho-muramoylpentapeptide beta-N-acetylglucosaminyltransferase [Desulfobacterales bacterium]